MTMHKQTMDLEAYIEEAFPQGLPYNDAAQLCLALKDSTRVGATDSKRPHCTGIYPTVPIASSCQAREDAERVIAARK